MTKDFLKNVEENGVTDDVESDPESSASSITSNEMDTESENDEKLKNLNEYDVFLKMKKVTLVVSPEDEAWCPITDGKSSTYLLHFQNPPYIS